MPSSSVFQSRAFSDNQTSTLGASGTQDIGVRLHGFAARTGPSTVVGGDFTVDSIAIRAPLTYTVTGGTIQLTADALTASGDSLADAVTWASDDTDVATVGASTGLVTIVGAGEANITASIDAEESDPCVITVTAVLTALVLADATLAFAHDSSDTTTVSATDQFEDAMALPSGIAVASSNEAKATVGILAEVITVTGVAAGTTNVTASKSGITSNTCVVTLS